ncbi:MAG: hypothetical protein KDH93_13375 [Rhodoferax sp.]|nr:hypothetical protein [Rhodoferax sp.]
MKQPPFARLLRERAHQHQSWWVLIGADAWDTANTWRNRPHRLFALCPPDADPRGLDWSVYRQAPPPVGLVRCGRVDGDQLHRLVQAMLSAGSPRLFDLLADAVYQPRRSAA